MNAPSQSGVSDEEVSRESVASWNAFSAASLRDWATTDASASKLDEPNSFGVMSRMTSCVTSPYEKVIFTLSPVKSMPIGIKALE